jgi:hypothetical protein
VGPLLGAKLGILLALPGLNWEHRSDRHWEEPLGRLLILRVEWGSIHSGALDMVGTDCATRRQAQGTAYTRGRAGASLGLALGAGSSTG